VCVCVKPAAFCNERPCAFVNVVRNPPSNVRQQIFPENLEPFNGIYLISPVIILSKHDLIY